MFTPSARKSMLFAAVTTLGAGVLILLGTLINKS